MHDKFEDFRTFVTVVHNRSFAAAARQLGVAKSAVSRRVQELEERLQARLLNRTTRALSLTEAGRVFFEKSTELLAAVEDAEASASGAGLVPAGKLRILAPATFGHLHLVPIVTSFLERHSRVTVEVSLHDEQQDLLASGFDLAVRIGGALPDSTMSARSLGLIRKVACASPAYLRRFGVPREPKELAQHRGIAYSEVAERDYWRFIDPRSGEEQSVRVPCRLRLDNGDALCAATVGGHGIAALPAFMIHKVVRAGDLVPLLLPFEKVPAQLYAVFPSRKLVPVKVRAFVEHMAERCSPEASWDRDVFEAGPLQSEGLRSA